MTGDLLSSYDDDSSSEELDEPSWKPDISHLEMAIDEKGNFIPGEGDQVVIERYCSVLPSKCWLDTCLYTIRELDYDNGNLRLWNETDEHYSWSNYVEGTLMGYSFRLPPKKGSFSKKKEIVYYDKGEEPLWVKPEDAIASAAAGPQPKVRAKNRPKHVIEAEKKKYEEQRAAKRAAIRAKRAK